MLAGLHVNNLLILLPTLNEERGLRKIAGRIPEKQINEIGWKSEVLVVDGNSNDGTKEIAVGSGFKFIKQVGFGKGAGIRTGFNYALKKKFDAVVMLDADATYSPEDIPKLISMLDEYDIVTGDRLRGNLTGDAMSTVNYFGNHALTWIACNLFTEEVGDLCTGYWAFTYEALNKLELNSMRFEIEAEMFCSSTKNGLRIASVPVSYSKREGEAKLGSISDGARILRKLLVRRLFPVPVESKVDNDKLALGK